MQFLPLAHTLITQSEKGRPLESSKGTGRQKSWAPALVLALAAV